MAKNLKIWAQYKDSGHGNVKENLSKKTLAEQYAKCATNEDGRGLIVQSVFLHYHIASTLNDVLLS